MRRPTNGGVSNKTFADFPPVNLDNAVTRIFDRHIPGWRTGANEPRPAISPEKNARLIAELKPRFEELERLRKRRHGRDAETGNR
jgi:hypothetical protein